MIVDCAAYSQGRRSTETLTLDEIGPWLAKDDTFVWLGLRMPTPEEVAEVTRVFALHPLAAEDALAAHDRAKMEWFGRTLLVVMRTAAFEAQPVNVRLGELAVLCGERFVITVRYGKASPLGGVRSSLEADPERLSQGPIVVLHAVLDRVVDDYLPVLLDLDRAVSDVEKEVFADDRRVSSGRHLYTLMREVLEFQEAVEPLQDPVARLAHGLRTGPDARTAPFFRDVGDNLARVVDRANRLRSLLATALEANLAQVGIRQNEDMRKISAWVAIAAVPTMVAGIYGMNFQNMPELNAEWGYPLVLAFMALICGLLYRAFRRSGWL